MQARRGQRQQHSETEWKPRLAAPVADVTTESPLIAERSPLPTGEPVHGSEAMTGETPTRDIERMGHGLARISILAPRASGGDTPIQRAPDPAGPTGDAGDGSPPGSDGAV